MLRSSSVRRPPRGPGFRLPVVMGAAALALALTACGQDGPSSGGGGGGAGGDQGGGQELSITFDGVTVAPGEEHTRCVVKRLPSTRAAHIDRIDTSLGPGSHHLIVYKTSDTEEEPTPFDCQPFADLLDPAAGMPLMIAQNAKDGLELPEGIGIAIEPGQMVRLEMHYINATSSPLEVSAKATFHEMDEADLEAEASLLFLANAVVEIPPMSQHSTGPRYLAIPPELDGVSFFSFTGHEHKLGTGVKVASAPGPDGPDTPVYDPPDFSWSEPPTERKDPPVTVPSGGGFRFTCEWNNTTPDQVTFGESANDEMCLVWAYYYPSQGVMACAHTDIVGDFCCPGAPICDMVF